MTRIIPQYEINTRKSLPNWINKEEIVKAGNNTKLPLKKQASKEESKIVVSYFCTPCKKVIAVEDKSIIQQKTLAKKSNKEFKPYCPNCGNELKIYKETGLKQNVSNLQSINESKVVDVLRKEGTYNTFVDRRIVYETIEKLARYASKLGMTGCVARYIKSEHAKGSSNKLSTFDEIECSLEWMYGRKQKGRATASVKIDPAGKFEFPRVFKVASGMEYPFEEKYIRMLEKDAHMFQSLPKRKKSDIPVYRKADPTRFRVTGSMKIGEFKKKSGEYPLTIHYYYQYDPYGSYHPSMQELQQELDEVVDNGSGNVGYQNPFSSLIIKNVNYDNQTLDVEGVTNEFADLENIKGDLDYILDSGNSNSGPRKDQIVFRMNPPGYIPSKEDLDADEQASKLHSPNELRWDRKIKKFLLKDSTTGETYTLLNSELVRDMLVSDYNIDEGDAFEIIKDAIEQGSVEF